MRIGILGGTFNPIHMGHLILAEEALSKLKLDNVIFVPTFIPPHKNIEGGARPKDRLKMVEIAIEDNPSFSVSTFELDSKKKSYSIDTLKEFKRQYGGNTGFYLITGSDLLKDLFDSIRHPLEIVIILDVREGKSPYRTGRNRDTHELFLL